MSKLNNSSPRPASFLQPSPGARASPRVPPRRALTLVTAGTVETWSGAARRRPNLISRGSTLARGAAHHRVIMLSERINENIYLQSVLQWPMTLLSSIYQVSWFKIHLHSHLRLSAKTGTLIEETKTEWKKWQIFHTRVITGTQKQENWDFSYQLVLWNLNMYGIWKWLASVMLPKTYLFTVFKLTTFSEDEQWREVLSRECDSSSVDTRTRGHVHLIPGLSPSLRLAMALKRQYAIRVVYLSNMVIAVSRYCNTRRHYRCCVVVVMENYKTDFFLFHPKLVTQVKSHNLHSLERAFWYDVQFTPL